MAEQENKETIVFLPWVVEPQPQTQSITLENPKEDKIYVDLAHSTDWVVAGSVLISFLGFLITVYVVRQSTKSQIQSNRELYQSQEKLKALEIQETRCKEIIDKICTLDGLRIETQVRVHMDKAKARKLSEPSLTIYINNLTEMRQILIRIPHLFKIYFNKEDIEQDIIHISIDINSVLFELTEFSGQSHTESLSTYVDILRIIDEVLELIDKMHLYLKN